MSYWYRIQRLFSCLWFAAIHIHVCENCKQINESHFSFVRVFFYFLHYWDWKQRWKVHQIGFALRNSEKRIKNTWNFAMNGNEKCLRWKNIADMLKPSLVKRGIFQSFWFIFDRLWSKIQLHTTYLLENPLEKKWEWSEEIALSKNRKLSYHVGGIHMYVAKSILLFITICPLRKSWLREIYDHCDNVTSEVRSLNQNHTKLNDYIVTLCVWWIQKVHSNLIAKSGIRIRLSFHFTSQSIWNRKKFVRILRNGSKIKRKHMNEIESCA